MDGDLVIPLLAFLSAVTKTKKRGGGAYGLDPEPGGHPVEDAGR